MATSVLGLKTFAASDPVDYNEINDNYNKIDNGVKTAMQGRAEHNLLDNSYWKVQSWIVNQRGATSYTLNGYTIDRWRTYHADNTVTVNSGNLSFTNTIYQNLIGIDASKTYTLAVCDPLGNITMMTSTPESGAWKNNLRLSSESEGVVRVAISKERSPLVWAALYEGSYTADTLPAYQPKGYAAELAECQRYYYAVEKELFFVAWADNNGCLDYTVLLPQTMRAIPTVTFDKLQYIDESGYVSFTNSPYYTGRDRVAIRKLGLTLNKAYGLSMKFSASADL